MFENAPFFPRRASALAGQVDHLFLFALAGAVLFSAIIALSILYLGVKYRRRAPGEVGVPPESQHSHATTILEITWSVIPMGLLAILFVWGARVYFDIARPPADAAEMYVVGKRWMWKVQHPEGNREINELHVPVGRPIKLTMTSEDVIHSFYLPEFRIKQDVLPGRYTTLWFRADRVGTYRLFCAEYCGAEHSRMGGHIVVMTPHDYQAWLGGERQGRTGLAQGGAALFTSHACDTCHRPDTSARAPLLTGLFGSRVSLQDGRVVVADEGYLRESILDPQAKIVAGYQPIMPTFKGQLGEEDLVHLIDYVKTLQGASKGGS